MFESLWIYCSSLSQNSIKQQRVDTDEMAHDESSNLHLQKLQKEIYVYSAGHVGLITWQCAYRGSKSVFLVL